MPPHSSRPGQGFADRMTDVTDFFYDIIDEYLLLEEQAFKIIDNIQNSAPDKLLTDCTALQQRKAGLKEKDNQLIDIIILAGRELTNTPLIHDYRIAFAKANMACNNLYQRLKVARLEFLEGIAASLKED